MCTFVCVCVHVCVPDCEDYPLGIKWVWGVVYNIIFLDSVIVYFLALSYTSWPWATSWETISLTLQVLLAAGCIPGTIIIINDLNAFILFFEYLHYVCVSVCVTCMDGWWKLLPKFNSILFPMVSAISHPHLTLPLCQDWWQGCVIKYPVIIKFLAAFTSHTYTS